MPSATLRIRMGWPARLVQSPLVQAFAFVMTGGMTGAWLGAQLGLAVVAIPVQGEALPAPTPSAVAMPVAASTGYTPLPTRTLIPTQTPQPVPPGPMPDRQPAVSPFVFARR